MREVSAPGCRETVISAVRTAYRLFRPLLGPRACRFHPTCSEYTFQSLRTHGVARGALLGVRRIVRCNPWNPGGFDPPPGAGAAGDKTGMETDR